MDIIQLLIVFGLGFLELWAAIPAGLALNLHPAVIIAVSSAGAIVAAAIVTVAGEKIRNRLLRWRYGGKDPKESRLGRLWNKYGIVGLGLLSPLLLGALIGAAVGSLLGGEKLRLLLWMSVGIVVWSAGLTAAGFFGIEFFNSLWR
ncbi:MAG: small multi-drug export protein [Candidatus Bathyarchaeota archaeon]|nr:small multi-drug export protein [Candidatus Bathyarchaeota archaeon]